MKTKTEASNFDRCASRPRRLLRWGGFTLVEIMIVVATLGILAGIAIPNFVKARNSAQVKACIANLFQINGAKAQWAIENRKGDNDVPLTTDIAPYLDAQKMPTCPANGTYRVRRVSRIPMCSLVWIGHTLNNLNMDDDPYAD